MTQDTAHHPTPPPRAGEPAPAPTTATAPDPAPDPAPVHVPYPRLLGFVRDVLAGRGLPPRRAEAAARALCHGDLTGFTSHGVANLTRLYLPLLDSGRCDPVAEPEIVADRGASVLWDARRALGLWAAGEAMDLAVERAREHGVGLVTVRGATHFGCAGYHALRAVPHRMVGLATANCGWQRLARPVGGRSPMLGTNPLALAAPAGDLPPFVLDMSTTAAPTGKIRAAARDGRTVPAGWLADDQGAPVTDPSAFDRGEAHLCWLGTDPTGAGHADHTGAHKGFGLGLLVEVLSALVPGAGTGPHEEDGPAQGGNDGERGRAGGTREGTDGARGGTGGPRGEDHRAAAERRPGRDDDIGYLLLAIAPGRLRSEGDFLRESGGVFSALLGCPPLRADRPVRYPGWWEDARSRARRRDGVPLDAALHRELLGLARDTGLPFPDPVEPPGPPDEAGGPADRPGTAGGRS